MAFNIRLTDGTLLTTVDDGTIDDTSCSVTLIGKNYVGYGTIYNDNLVHLLENFSSDDPPTNPLDGQLWWDKSGNLKVYTGSVTGFKTISTIITTATEPANGITGQSYWNSTTNQLFVYDGSQWVLIGPLNEQGTTGLLTDTITDINNSTHTVSKMFVNSTLIGIYSRDQEFTPTPLISGFNTVKPGFNFVSNAAIGNIGLWGSASQLGGIDSTFYARTDIAETFNSNLTVVGNLVSSGNISTTANTTATYFLGNGAYLTGVTSYSNTNVASYLPTYTGNLQSMTGNIVTTANISGSFFLGNGAFLTGLPATYSNVNVQNYLPTYTGNLVSLTGNVITTANVHADYFVGTAVEALYADLAERFTTDKNYPAGTVVRIGGEFEITQENEEASNNVFGVISSDPAYTMNSSLANSLPVALTGKVPVRTIGLVAKGDRLISAGQGLAKAGNFTEITPYNILGRSLEHKYSLDEGLVLTFVSVNK